MPSVIPPAQYPAPANYNPQSTSYAGAKETGVAGKVAEVTRAVSPAPSQPNNAELGLMATGLDIDMLASESFKTEECTFTPSLRCVRI